ncbi:hypothetical protein ACR79N_16165 [Sphingobacterium siyangense]|uniref:hypothetical protein n=1 Tax=Sphingobacterium siyangense TaxID=459529 RepID=UPI003DA60CC6
MAIVKFWQGMDKASNIVGADKMMIGKNETGEAQYVDFQDANQFLSIQGESMPAIQGGTTAATAVALPAGPTGQNRWFDASWGYWKYNNTVLKNPLGTDGIPQGNDGMLYWNGTTETWSISKMQELRMPTGVPVINPLGSGLPTEKATADYINNYDVKFEQLAFTESGTNKFNKADVISEKYVYYVNGALVDNTGYCVSMIPVKPNTKYSRNNPNKHFAWLDASGVFINNPNAPESTTTITSPINAGFISLSVLNANKNIQMFVEGNSVPAYEPYKEYIPEDKLKISSANTIEPTGRRLVQEQAVPKYVQAYRMPYEQLAFLKMGVNLFDKSRITAGKYVYYEDGSLLDNPNYSTSALIPVEGDTLYARNNPLQHFVWLDANGVLIPNPNAPQTTIAIKSPVNAKYHLFSILNTNVNTQMFVKGSTVPGYEQFFQLIPNEKLELIKTDDVANVINIPSTIYGLVGMTTNLYFETIFNKPEEKDIKSSCIIGRQLKDRYTHTPTISETRQITITSEKDGKVLKSKIVNFIIKSKFENTSNFVLLFQGDSNTFYGFYTQRLLNNFISDGYSTCTLIGTKGSGANRFEATPGWSALVYTKYAELSGKVNEFWNPATGKFDATYFMTHNGFSGLTHVFIPLGTNDIFDPESDDTLKTTTAAAVAAYDEIIASYKAYDPNLKICIMATIPASNSQDIFGSVYNANKTRWRFKRNLDYFVSELIRKYDNRTSEKIYVVGSNLGINPSTDFEGSVSTPAVHLNSTGYNNLGDDVYKFLKCIG